MWRAYIVTLFDYAVVLGGARKIKAWCLFASTPGAWQRGDWILNKRDLRVLIMGEKTWDNFTRLLTGRLTLFTFSNFTTILDNRAALSRSLHYIFLLVVGFFTYLFDLDQLWVWRHFLEGRHAHAQYSILASGSRTVVTFWTNTRYTVPGTLGGGFVI